MGSGLFCPKPAALLPWIICSSLFPAPAWVLGSHLYVLLIDWRDSINRYLNYREHVVANIFVNLLSESGIEQKNDIQHSTFIWNVFPSKKIQADETGFKPRNDSLFHVLRFNMYACIHVHIRVTSVCITMHTCQIYVYFCPPGILSSTIHWIYWLNSWELVLELLWSCLDEILMNQFP